MRRRRTAILLLSVVLPLLGCSGFTASPAPGSSTTRQSPAGAPASTAAAGTRASSTPTTAAASAALVVHADGHAVTSFATPTGGIVCDVGSDAHLRCDVPFSTWTLPPRPANCQQGWGASVDFGAAGGALTCPHDSIIADAAPGAAGTWWQKAAAAQVVTADVATHDATGLPVVALPYGGSVLVAANPTPLTCSVAPSGVTCTIGTHRMVLSRASYSLS